MGISASQARLLSITARLTSNEYESQQISNAKMRLSTQSEEASSNYLAALNASQLMFRAFDAQGDAVNTQLTANVLYQYSDMKNQYAIVNNSGQMLISSTDARNFEASKNLDEFLGKYGVKKVYKTETLQKNYDAVSSDAYRAVYDTWEGLVNDVKQRNNFSGEYTIEYDKNNPIKASYNNATSTQAFEYEAYGTYLEYNMSEINYKNALANPNISADLLQSYEEAFNDANQKLMDCSTYQNWCNAKAMENAKLSYYEEKSGQWLTPNSKGYDIAKLSYYDESGLLLTPNSEGYDSTKVNVPLLSDAITEYYERVEEFQMEAQDLDYTTLTDTYTYSDTSKAQWYTNMWYRLNGDSSNKSSQGEKAANYAVIDNKLASSSQWIQDSLKQGIISLELASVNDAGVVLENQIEQISDTLNVKLTGISWDKKIYSTSSDFISVDADAVVAKAEAEYERKNAEISAKDQKYQNKIKKLDIEHQALQEQYNSVKAAMEKNIGRSFKTFNS